MNIVFYVKQNLEELSHLINLLDDENYVERSELISGSSIGAHVRHILEFYAAAVYANNTICYDKRKRDATVEASRVVAISYVRNLVNHLDTISNDHSIDVQADYSVHGDELITFQSTLFRELAYTLEHSVHHLAIIKIAVRHILSGTTVPEIGVSSATKRHQLSNKY